MSIWPRLDVTPRSGVSPPRRSSASTFNESLSEYDLEKGPVVPLGKSGSFFTDPFGFETRTSGSPYPYSGQ